MLKHRNAKKALLDIIEELEKSVPVVFVGSGNLLQNQNLAMYTTKYQKFWAKVRSLLNKVLK